MCACVCIIPENYCIFTKNNIHSHSVSNKGSDYTYCELNVSGILNTHTQIIAYMYMGFGIREQDLIDMNHTSLWGFYGDGVG